MSPIYPQNNVPPGTPPKANVQVLDDPHHSKCPDIPGSCALQMLTVECTISKQINS